MEACFGENAWPRGAKIGKRVAPGALSISTTTKSRGKVSHDTLQKGGTPSARSRSTVDDSPLALLVAKN
jgi:hypothetical protein